MDEVEFLMEAHGLAMSNDYGEAAYGRFLKEFVPRYRAFILAERERPDHTAGEFANSCVLGISSLIAMYASVCGRPECFSEVRKLFIEALTACENDKGPENART